jgi:hypothetical protein
LVDNSSISRCPVLARATIVSIIVTTIVISVVSGMQGVQ